MSWTSPRRGEPDPAKQLANAVERIVNERSGRPVERQRGGHVYRLRRQLAPWLVVILLVAAAGGANLAGWITGSPAAVGKVVLVIAVAIGLSAALLVVRRMPPVWRARAAMGVASGAVWLPWAAEAITWTKLACLLLPFYGLKARHDRQVRPTLPVTRPEPEHVIPTTYADRWAKSVGADGYAVPGAILGAGRHEERSGVVSVRHTVQLVPGRQSVDSLRAALPLVASGLRHPLPDLVVDDHESGDPSRAVLKIITRTPFNEPVYFDAPRYENGRVLLGPCVDGDGWAGWRLYTPKSMWGGVLIGGIGSGKSRLLEMLVLTAIAQGHTTYVYVDGQNGASSPTLKEHALLFAGMSDVDMMLAALEAAHQYRQGWFVEQRRGFRPTPDMPGLLVPVDEAHRVVTQDNAARWANLTRETRKNGIAIVMADQDASLETFKTNVLRGTLMDGNTIGMRTQSRESGQILGANDLNLHDLPKIPGRGCVLNTGQVGARTAPFQGLFLPDLDDRDEGNSPSEVETVEEWFDRTPTPALDEGTMRALMTIVSGWGVPEPTSATPDIGGGTVIPLFPAPWRFEDDNGGSSPVEDERPAPSPAGRSPARAQILAAVQAGAGSHGEVVAATDLSDRRVRDVLDELVPAGLVVRLNKHGRIAPAADCAAGGA